MSKRSSLVCAVAVFVTLSAGNFVLAQDFTTSPSLPPMNGDYVSAPSVHATYPSYQADLIDVQHFGFNNVNSVVAGQDLVENFNSTVTGLLSVASLPYFPVTLTGPVKVEIFNYTDGQTGTFNTQMLSMDVSGAAMGHSVEIMLSQASPGQTTITPLGGGNFRIDSFFDIFTDLSLDGGPFSPSSNAPALVTLEPEPKSLSFMGLAAIAMLARRRLRHA